MAVVRILCSEALDDLDGCGELHDSMGQTLGALSNNLATAARFVPDDTSDALHTLLVESASMVETVTQEIRAPSYLLHPPMLDDLGLEYVLPWCAI